ncbi:MAG: hypothetical protein HFI09_01005 [Bacilli bacterium]|nr:hypothetical protein [Bacilli bacterium]
MLKNKKIILISIIALIGIGSCLLVGYFVSKPKEMDINSDLIQDLYNSVNPSSDYNVASLLYTTNPLSNKYIIDIGLMAYIREHGKENSEVIPKEEVEKNIERILGQVSYVHEKVFLFEEVCAYSYNNDKKQYEVYGGCGGNWDERIHRKIVSAKKTRNQIIITEKMIYESDDWDTTTSRRTVYSDVNKTKQLDYKEVSSNGKYSIKLEDYIEDASTYEYVFEKKDDHYIFKQITQIN